MARIKKSSAIKTDRLLKWSTIILAILGTLDAIYLLVLKYTQAEAMCVGNHGCITVNNSVYSEIYGIPVSVFGIMAYLVIVAIVLVESRIKLARENGPLAVLGISLAGVAFSAYLTYLEFYVIHAVCPFCITSAIVITLIFILAVIRLIKQTAL
jgi:uncharacterized membrane protein